MPDLSIEVAGLGTIPAYYSPAVGAPGRAPSVVVIHEAFGLTTAMREAADQMAARGYHALAPDLMSYAGSTRCLVAIARSLSSGEGRAFEEIHAARQWLADREDSTEKVGVLGFCLGGAFALLLAGQGFDASAAMYGQLPSRLDSVFDGACPVVASYGGKDRTLRGATAKLETALAAAGVEHDVKEYADAGHSFMTHSESDAPAWMRPFSRRLMHVGYVDTAAADSWSRIDSLFTTALGD